MKEPFVFYRALDPVKGSWDGYGFFPMDEGDFLVFVADAPSGASVQTPELIKAYWLDWCRTSQSFANAMEKILLADGVNRLQEALIQRSRKDGANYQSTLALARKSGDRLFCLSAGDSVLQLVRGGVLYRLAAAEVWDGALVIDGQLKPGERRRTGEIAFVGNSGKFLPPEAVLEVPLRAGDCLLLHSDGLEDLLPPDRLLAACTSGTLPAEMERTFAPEKLKDDVTLIAVDVEVPEAFDAQVEIAYLRSQLESLQKEQAQFRNDLARVAVSPSRLEKMEKNLQELSEMEQMHRGRQESTRRRASEPSGPAAPSTALRTPGASWLRKWWYPAIIILLAVVAAITFAKLLSRPPAPEPKNGDTVRPPVSRHQLEPESPAIAPPEMRPSEEECTYTVIRGDTLEKIAADKKIPVAQLLKWNPPMQQDSVLKVGQKLNTCGEEQP
jgi:serine/threonine protein phosphatase PrpC